MAKEKDPAFLLYTQDFITGTFFMTNEQRGKYILLLCLQHQKGHLTDEQMLKVLQDDDVEVFSKFMQDEDGKWFNARLDRENVKRSEGAIWRAENGRKGGLAKAKNKQDSSKTSSKNLPRALEDEDESERSKSTIETNSPNHLFDQKNNSTQSLDDLYLDIENEL
jgi:uncharacterized protein YdaU (DUF1376 family)